MKYLVTVILIFSFSFFTSCEDFLTGENLDNNPNKVGDVDQISVEALFVGSQVTLYGVMEGYLSRLVTMFMQQLGGQLYSHADDYKCAPLDWRLDDRWSDLYGTGGLVDLRTIQNKSGTQEKYLLKETQPGPPFAIFCKSLILTKLTGTLIFIFALLNKAAKSADI